MGRGWEGTRAALGRVACHICGGPDAQGLRLPWLELESSGSTQNTSRVSGGCNKSGAAGVVTKRDRVWVSGGPSRVHGE